MKSTILTAPAAALLIATSFEAVVQEVQSKPPIVIQTEDVRTIQRLARFRYANPKDGVTVSGGREGLTLTIGRGGDGAPIFAWLLSLRWEQYTHEDGYQRWYVRGYTHGDTPTDIDLFRLANADQQMNWIIAPALAMMRNHDSDDTALRDHVMERLVQFQRRRYTPQRDRALGVQRIGGTR